MEEADPHQPANSDHLEIAFSNPAPNGPEGHLVVRGSLLRGQQRSERRSRLRVMVGSTMLGRTPSHVGDLAGFCPTHERCFRGLLG